MTRNPEPVGPDLLPPAAKQTKDRGALRMIVSAGLILGSLGWVVYLLAAEGIDLVADGWAPPSWAWVVAGLLGLASSLMKARVFSLLLLSREVGAAVPRTEGVFLISQVVRYLPGRVWGVVYSAVRLSDTIPQRSVWWANLEHFLISSINSLAVAAAATLWYLDYTVWAMTVLVLAWSGLALELRNRFGARLLARVRGVGRDAVSFRAPAESSAIFAWLQFDWLVYVLIWVVLLMTRFDPLEAFMLSALYAVAWMIGLVALVVPAGLLVREASFTWLGVIFGFQLDDLVLIMAAARLFFLVIDLAACGAGFLMVRHGGAPQRASDA